MWFFISIGLFILSYLKDISWLMKTILVISGLNALFGFLMFGPMSGFPYLAMTVLFFYFYQKKKKGFHEESNKDLEGKLAQFDKEKKKQRDIA